MSQANYIAAAENVAGFMVAFAKQEGVEPRPILPCHGSERVEALKRAALSQGIGFTTDDCTIPRSRFARGE